MKTLTLLGFYFLFFFTTVFSQDSTYADRLGFPKGARVIILHVDDVGMSYDSNEGAIMAMTKGIASSCSVMMPCPWVPGFIHYMKQHPGLDAGLHLTLTSEWKDYRWAPLSGKLKVPGLVDNEGAMWPDVASVVAHATPDEVETEIRAQVERAKTMGFQPTHMDSHMGTVFASPAFIQRYVKLGMEYHIPVMFPGGHATLIVKQMHFPDSQKQMLKMVGRQLWDAGLPVLDDIYNETYGWKLPDGKEFSDRDLSKFRTRQYIEALRSIKPGITYVIMHCTETSEIFKYISDSGPTRRGDMLAMQNPELKKFIEQQGIIVTTWKELMERRQKIK